MTAARHHGRTEFVLRRQHIEYVEDFGGQVGHHGGGGVFGLIDRPLRRLAGGDVALLRIYRGTLIGSVAAAVAALAAGAIL